MERALIVSGPLDSVLWPLVLFPISTSVWADFESLSLGQTEPTSVWSPSPEWTPSPELLDDA